jgi:hypothetical protein
MKKRKPLAKLYWPPTTPELLQAIGRCVVAWGMLERAMSDIIGDCLLVTPTMGMTVSANLSVTGKLNLLRAIIDIQEGAFSKAVGVDLDKLSSRTHKSATEYRDFFAHGQPYPVRLEDGDMWIWAKMGAKKGGLKGTMRRLEAAGITPMADEITKLAEDWHKFRETARDGVEVLRMVRNSELSDDAYDDE